MNKKKEPAAHHKVLQGRKIGDVQFTGLTERLAQTNALAVLLDELAETLDPTDVKGIAAMIMQAVDEANAFAGIKPNEWAAVTDYTMRGLKLDRE